MENMKGTANVLADKALLDVLASNPTTQIAKTAFQTILDVLDKVSLPSSLDHGILQKIYDHLRNWSSFMDVFSVIPLLARVYDNLIHRDLGQPKVSNAVCELLFLIEDMADNQQCKILAGEHFLQRLLALAGSRLTGTKLQRVAVETLSSIILMCPPNQKLLSKDFLAEWSALFFRRVLPLCGDFFVQASIVEILYRISKQSPGILDCLEENTLREQMVSLHQTKKPDLLVETRIFLERLNHCSGKSRSVYSFLAEDIVFDGRSTPLMDERWVHFGMDHMSCYAAVDSEQNPSNVGLVLDVKIAFVSSLWLTDYFVQASKNVSLLDVFYNRIYDVQVCSNHTIDFAFRESLAPAQDTWIRLKTLRLKIVLKTDDLEILKDSVLSRIKYYQKELQKGCSKAVDSENTNTTPSFSAKAERSFRKASVGFAIPLPRKFKLPSRSSCTNQQIVVNSKVSGNLLTHAKEVSTQGNAIRKNGCIDNGIHDLDAVKSSTQVANPITKSEETNNCLSEKQPEVFKEASPKQDMFPCLQPINKCKVLPSFSHMKGETAMGAKKSRNSPLSKKDTVSSCGTDACLNTTNSGHTPNRPKLRTNCDSERENGDNEVKPSLQLVLGENASGHCNVGTVENALQRSPLTKSGRTATNKASIPKDGKLADMRHATQLHDRILNILNDANLLESDDIRKRMNSTSDPIETDSEQNRSVPRNIKVISRSTVKQKPHDFCRSQEVKATYRIKRRNGPLLENNDRHLNKASEKDVFSFDEDEQPPAKDSQRLATKDSKEKCVKLANSKADNCLAGDQPFPADDQQNTAANGSKEMLTKSKADNHPKDQPFPAHDQQYTAGNDSKEKLTKSKADNYLAKGQPFPADHQECTAANNLKEKRFEAGGSYIADLIQPDTPTVSPNLFDVKVRCSEEPFLFKNVHRVRQRKRDTNTDKSPAKKAKKSPELALALENRGPLMSREVPAYDESPMVGGKSHVELDKELLICYTSPEQTEKEANKSWKSPCFPADEHRLQFRSSSVSFAKGPNVETRRRARRRNRRLSGTVQKPADVNMSLIDEHTQIIESTDLEAVPNGEIQLIAALIQKMMKKIKVKTENKSAEILSSAMVAVQQRCQELEKICFAILRSSSLSLRKRLLCYLAEQHETFQDLQKKWRIEFENGLSHFKEISSQFDSSQSYLKSISDNQKIAHRRLFSSMGEFVELHLNETEQKLLAWQKAARGVRNELKVALLRIL
ncbi:hypothetical protein L7F22_027049 [Adiantum nelumboides]|nr:hypothetical protein [Adiantum nelumboides]